MPGQNIWKLLRYKTLIKSKKSKSYQTTEDSADSIDTTGKLGPRPKNEDSSASETTTLKQNPSVKTERNTNDIHENDTDSSPKRLQTPSIVGVDIYIDESNVQTGESLENKNEEPSPSKQINEDSNQGKLASLSLPISNYPESNAVIEGPIKGKLGLLKRKKSRKYDEPLTETQDDLSAKDNEIESDLNFSFTQLDPTHGARYDGNVSTEAKPSDEPVTSTKETTKKVVEMSKTKIGKLGALESRKKSQKHKAALTDTMDEDKDSNSEQLENIIKVQRSNAKRSKDKHDIKDNENRTKSDPHKALIFSEQTSSRKGYIVEPSRNMVTQNDELKPSPVQASNRKMSIVEPSEGIITPSDKLGASPQQSSSRKVSIVEPSKDIFTQHDELDPMPVEKINSKNDIVEPNKDMVRQNGELEPTSVQTSNTNVSIREASKKNDGKPDTHKGKLGPLFKRKRPNKYNVEQTTSKDQHKETYTNQEHSLFTESELTDKQPDTREQTVKPNREPEPKGKRQGAKQHKKDESNKDNFNRQTVDGESSKTRSQRTSKDKLGRSTPNRKKTQYFDTARGENISQATTDDMISLQDNIQTITGSNVVVSRDTTTGSVISDPLKQKGAKVGVDPKKQNNGRDYFSFTKIEHPNWQNIDQKENMRDTSIKDKVIPVNDNNTFDIEQRETEEDKLRKLSRKTSQKPNEEIDKLASTSHNNTENVLTNVAVRTSSGGKIHVIGDECSDLNGDDEAEPNEHEIDLTFTFIQRSPSGSDFDKLETCSDRIGIARDSASKSEIDNESDDDALKCDADDIKETDITQSADNAPIVQLFKSEIQSSKESDKYIAKQNKTTSRRRYVDLPNTRNVDTAGKLYRRKTIEISNDIKSVADKDHTHDMCARRNTIGIPPKNISPCAVKERIVDTLAKRVAFEISTNNTNKKLALGVDEENTPTTLARGKTTEIPNRTSNAVQDQESSPVTLARGKTSVNHTKYSTPTDSKESIPKTLLRRKTIAVPNERIIPDSNKDSIPDMLARRKTIGIPNEKTTLFTCYESGQSNRSSILKTTNSSKRNCKSKNSTIKTDLLNSDTDESVRSNNTAKLVRLKDYSRETDKQRHNDKDNITVEYYAPNESARARRRDRKYGSENTVKNLPTLMQDHKNIDKDKHSECMSSISLDVGYPSKERKVHGATSVSSQNTLNISNQFDNSSDTKFSYESDFTSPMDSKLSVSALMEEIDNVKGNSANERIVSDAHTSSHNAQHSFYVSDQEYFKLVRDPSHYEYDDMKENPHCSSTKPTHNELAIQSKHAIRPITTDAYNQKYTNHRSAKETKEKSYGHINGGLKGYYESKNVKCYPLTKSAIEAETRIVNQEGIEDILDASLVNGDDVQLVTEETPSGEINVVAKPRHNKEFYRKTKSPIIASNDPESFARQFLGTERNLTHQMIKLSRHDPLWREYFKDQTPQHVLERDLQEIERKRFYEDRSD